MKRLSFTLVFISCTIIAFAQESSCAIGLQLGFSQSIYRCNEPAKDDLGKINLNGGKVGFVFEGTIIKGFGAYIAMNYTYGGGSTAWAKKSPNQEAVYPQTRSRYNLHALELTCDWQYKFEVAHNTYIILYTGPTVQCNLSLHETDWEKTFDGEKKGKTIQVIGDYNSEELAKAYKRWNTTWGVGAGFQYERYYIRGGYDFGLINPYVINNFDEVGYDSRLTRGRQDQWYVKLGLYLWQSDK